MSRTLVTGAGGFIGGRFARKLLGDGREVRALVRADAPELARAGAEIVRGDVTDSASRERAIAGCDAVVHAAALVSESKPSDADYLRANAEATEALARAAAEAGVSRFVFMSSIAIHASSETEVVEDSPAAPHDAYGRSKLEAERRLGAVARETGMRIAIVRPSRVYGPGDRALLPALRAIARRRFPLVGGGRARVDFLHVDDLVAALEAAAERGEGAFVVGGPRAVEIRDFFAAFAAALGTTLLPLSLPAEPAMLAARILERACALAGREAPVTPKKLAFFRNTRLVSSARAARELGWRPTIDVGAGARATILWYRAAGWL